MHSSTSTTPLPATSGPSAPEWIHLVPMGEFVGIDGRRFRVADPDAVIEASRKYAGRRKMVIDYEHQTKFSVQNGQPAPAAGWITGLQRRDDGIWGRVDWTDAAAKRIGSKEYRYISPVFFHTDDGTVTLLTEASLTNVPNLDQLTALSRAEVTMDTSDLSTKLKAAATLIGLPDTADQATIIGRLRQIGSVAAELATLTGDQTIAINSASPDPTRFVPIGEFERVVADANKLRQGITEKAAMQRVDDEIRQGNLAPFLRDWAVSLCNVNVPAFDSFMKRVGPAFNRIVTPSACEGDPTARGLHTPDEQEAEVIARMGLTPDEFNKAR